MAGLDPAIHEQKGPLRRGRPSLHCDIAPLTMGFAPLNPSYLLAFRVTP